MSIWASASAGGDAQASLLFDQWKRAGVTPEAYVVPSARSRDGEFNASFPGVYIAPRPAVPESFQYTLDQVPTADNKWQGGNLGSFRDAEVDGLQRLVLTRLAGSDSWKQALIAREKRLAET